MSISKEKLFYKFVGEPIDFPLFIPMDWLAYLFSLFFLCVVKVRIWLYRNNILSSEKIGAKVISVGNITLGGTGKTPFTIFLARYFRDKGFAVATVSRGYKAESDEVIIVSDGKSIKSYPNECGDEPYLIAEKLNGVVVLACKNRVKAAKLAEKKFGAEIIILDGGFQHFRLRRDLDIVILDTSIDFGNNKLLPRGTLREPISHLQRAHIVIFNKYKDSPYVKALENKIKKINPKCEIFKSVYQPVELKNRIKGKRILAVSAIANPNYFYSLIEDFGGKIAYKSEFPDHHNFSLKDKHNIEKMAKDTHCDLVVITDKDRVKIKFLGNWNIPLLSFSIDVKLLDENAFKRKLSDFVGDNWAN